MVETTLAISYFFTCKGIGYNVYTGWKQQSFCTVQGMNAYEGLYSYMSTMTFDEESSVEIQLEDVNRSGLLNDSRLLILVCHEVSQGLFWQLRELADKGMMVVIYFITDDDGDAVLREASERIRIVKISTTEQLEGGL